LQKGGESQSEKTFGIWTWVSKMKWKEKGESGKILPAQNKNIEGKVVGWGA